MNLCEQIISSCPIISDCRYDWRSSTLKVYVLTDHNKEIGSLKIKILKIIAAHVLTYSVQNLQFFY